MPRIFYKGVKKEELRTISFILYIFLVLHFLFNYFEKTAKTKKTTFVLEFQDSTVRVELSGAELGDADLKVSENGKKTGRNGEKRKQRKREKEVRS